ncbi:MAG TPA: HDOD domain-containing protein [Polyangiaceae bacterium]|nr:HDOD domain-containing protein [Polyangiaceae bacterium]
MTTASNAAVAIDEELWFGSPGDDKELEERASQSMAAVAARVLGAKPFPAAARKLEELTRSGGAKIEQVVGVLESDPGLSMRLLRLVNSAGYALRVRCTSVRHAAALVGMRRLHQLATTAAVLDLFETSNPAVKSLLNHAAVVGAFCRYLAVHVDLAPDELFTCGFLHDIGKLMLVDAEGAPYLELVEQAGENPDALYVLEQEKYGFDHAVLGAHVLKNWRIPNPVPRVVAWHHNVARALQADASIAAMVQALRLADHLSYLVRTHAEPEGITVAAQSPAATYLGVSEAQLSNMWPDLARLSQRINAVPGGDQAEVIPREESMPPSLRPRGKKSKLPLASVPPASLRPEGGPISEMPKHFVCIVCKKASFGNRCPVCSGHVCAEHQVGAEQWCTECTAAYDLEVGRVAFPMWERLTALGIVLGAGLLSVGVAVVAGRPVLGALFGSMLLSSLCVLLVIVGRRFWLKRSFLLERARSHASDEAVLPLGLTMPPEPSIALLSDAPVISLRPTERINPPVEPAGLPALFSVAPTAIAPLRSEAPAAASPSAAPAPALDPAPARDPAPERSEAQALLSPHNATARESMPTTVPGHGSVPKLSVVPAIAPAQPPPPETAATPFDAEPPTQVDSKPPTELAPPRRTDALAAREDAPKTRPDAHSEPPPGWRPIERTEPAMPASRGADSSELRRLAEALPSIPPALDVPLQASAPSEYAAPARTGTEPPRAPAEARTGTERPGAAPALHAATMPLPAFVPPPEAAAPAAPVTMPAANDVSAPAAAAPDLTLASRQAVSPEPEAAPAPAPAEAPVPVPAYCEAPPDPIAVLAPPSLQVPAVPVVCNAVAPSLLVGCRPLSIKPKNYACSPGGGR